MENAMEIRGSRMRPEARFDTTANGDPRELDHVAFRSAVACIASFRCPSDHPRFRDSGPIGSHIFVFPRRFVALCHEGGEPFIADPGIVTLYNQGQRYRRTAVAGSSDESEWFAVAPDVLLDAVRQIDPWVDDRPARPFRHAYAPCHARVYLVQRRLYDRLMQDDRVDPLWVEETVLWLLSEVLEGMQGFWSGGSRIRAAGVRADEIAEEAKLALAQDLGQPLQLGDIARMVGVSVFQLSRAFKAVTGTTLHAYRTQVRMRCALERLHDKADLTTIALDLGFSSHSHFSAAFRQVFGVTPSSARLPAMPAEPR
jgi:AraC family transcriptional regulator